MATVDYDFPQLKDALDRKEGVLLLDFWASWCGPCRAFAPIYEKVSEDYPDATFAKIDTEKEQALASSFGIRSIPTLMVFRDGILLYSQPGMVPEAGLRDLMRQVEALDMDEVKREVAEQLDSAGS